MQKDNPGINMKKIMFDWWKRIHLKLKVNVHDHGTEMGYACCLE